MEKRRNIQQDNCIPHELIALLGRPKAPKQIWQEPFDYIRGHCERIADTSKPTDMFDFGKYFMDYQYMDVQRDLLKFALPHALEGWARTVLGVQSPDQFKGDWNFEGMWEALAHRPLYPDFLTDKQNNALMSFLVSVLIALMEKEKDLHFKGSGATPYDWATLHATLICLFPVAEAVWKHWWGLPTPAMAICAVQWLSAFLYDEEEDPYFSPWTPSEGGGPPLIFDTHFLRHKSADQESVAFLKATLQPTWATDVLKRSLRVLSDHPKVNVVEKTLAEFEWRSVLFEERVEKLIAVLERKEAWNVNGWEEI